MRRNESVEQALETVSASLCNRMAAVERWMGAITDAKELAEGNTSIFVLGQLNILASALAGNEVDIGLQMRRIYVERLDRITRGNDDPLDSTVFVYDQMLGLWAQVRQLKARELLVSQQSDLSVDISDLESSRFYGVLRQLSVAADGVQAAGGDLVSAGEDLRRQMGVCAKSLSYHKDVRKFTEDMILRYPERASEEGLDSIDMAIAKDQILLFIFGQMNAIVEQMKQLSSRSLVGSDVNIEQQLSLLYAFISMRQMARLEMTAAVQENGDQAIFLCRDLINLWERVKQLKPRPLMARPDLTAEPRLEDVASINRAMLTLRSVLATLLTQVILPAEPDIHPPAVKPSGVASVTQTSMFKPPEPLAPLQVAPGQQAVKKPTPPAIPRQPGSKGRPKKPMLPSTPRQSDSEQRSLPPLRVPGQQGKKPEPLADADLRAEGRAVKLEPYKPLGPLRVRGRR